MIQPKCSVCFLLRQTLFVESEHDSDQTVQRHKNIMTEKNKNKTRTRNLKKIQEISLEI